MKSIILAGWHMNSRTHLEVDEIACSPYTLVSIILVNESSPCISKALFPSYLR